MNSAVYIIEKLSKDFNIHGIGYNDSNHITVTLQDSTYQVPPSQKTNSLPTIRAFPKIGIPQNGWFIIENPIESGWFGGPTPFLETSIHLTGASRLVSGKVEYLSRNAPRPRVEHQLFWNDFAASKKGPKLWLLAMHFGVQFPQKEWHGSCKWTQQNIIF